TLRVWALIFCQVTKHAINICPLLPEYTYLLLHIWKYYWFVIRCTWGFTIIVYRLPWTWKCSKLLMKFIHAGLNTIAMILAIVSMVAVFEYHNARNIPNMYSLHSWIGLTAVIFYSLQLLLGFAVFLLPFAAVPLRAALMPIHIYSGLLIFATVIASALMGITEKLIFSLKNPAYSTSPPEAIFVNCLGLLIVIFGALVLWMASRPHWKRPPEELPKLTERQF
uniref:Plasma membrane ascorbate-dependent reductase CYBRD1 n=1 Tax=Apteryx owenii TaxID=8824 RepID=A0A8B9P007_APTOW